MFSEGVVLDVSQAYELQSAVAQLRCDRGEKTIGYKVGCTSPEIRRQLEIDHCVSGRLFDTERHTSGAQLSRNRFANLAIEGELAVELSREPRAEDFSAGIIPACVARVFPVIELHHLVMRGERPSATELIANNAIHAGFVAGVGTPRSKLPGGRLLEAPALSIFADGRLLEGCAGPSLVQTIETSLKWLTEIVRERGDRLRSGQTVLTGSIPRLLPVGENCDIRVEAPPFGEVRVKFKS